MSSISGESSHPQPQRKGTTATHNAPGKINAQLKLPIPMNRTMTSSSTPRAQTESNGAEELKAFPTQNPREKESTRALSRNQLSELRGTSMNDEGKEAQQDSARNSSLKVDAKEREISQRSPRKISRQETSKTQQTTESRTRSENERVRREKEKKMKAREEQEKRFQVLREEKEKEERYQEYLKEEHRRWKIREKQFGQRKRSVLERLFLVVGEKSEFEEDDAYDAEEVKVIQGTLAAELLELIEKSRLNRPPVVSTPVSSKPEEGDSGKIANGDEKSENSSFDEDEYFREIAALSFAEGGEDEDMGQSTGKVSSSLSPSRTLTDSFREFSVKYSACQTR